MDGRPNPVTVLVFGILSIVLCGLFLGIPAWIMGNNALRMESSYPEGEIGMIKAGRILGIIGTCLSLFGCCLGGINNSNSRNRFGTEFPSSRPAIVQSMTSRVG
jgi:hypothetical protein